MLVWWETILSGLLLRFFFCCCFLSLCMDKFHERFLLLRYSDAGTFNLIIKKIGFIKIFYSEVKFVKPSQKKSKRFRKLRLLFRTNSFWRYMNKYHPRRTRNHCYLYPLKTSEITAVSVTNSHFIHSCIS